MNTYFNLMDGINQRIASGTEPLDPVIRSMARKAGKLLDGLNLRELEEIENRQGLRQWQVDAMANPYAY